MVAMSDNIRKYCDQAGMPENSPLRVALISINETAESVHDAVANMSRIPEKAVLDRIGLEARNIFNIYAESAVRHFRYRTILYAALALLGVGFAGHLEGRMTAPDGLDQTCLAQGDIRVDAKGNRYCVIVLSGPTQTPSVTR